MTATAQNPCEILAATLSRLFVCSPHGDFTRVRTPYLYPDGDSIDLFVKPRLDGVGGTISDLGETIRWLRGQTVSPRRTPRQAAMISDICMTHNVEFFKGMLQARYENNNAFADVATRVAQASLRVSDLWLSFRNRAVESVTEEVEEYLIEQKIAFEKVPRLPGRSGRIWTPHFHARTDVQSSLIYVLATGSRSAARAVTEHVVTAWYDLSNLRTGQNPTEFVSLFDDTADVWADQDFALVRSLSRIARWSEPDEFAQILRRAG